MRFADNSIVSDPGSPIHTLYSPKVGKGGKIELVESGFENTDEIIQSYAESTDIRVILNRVANGETELLHQRNGIFGDFTGFPKTYAEALQLHIDSNRLFESLPAEVKEKFHNDENEFFSSAGSEEWAKNLGELIPSEVRKAFEAPDVKEPVSDKEVKTE